MRESRDDLVGERANWQRQVRRGGNVQTWGSDEWAGFVCGLLNFRGRVKVPCLSPIVVTLLDLDNSNNTTTIAEWKW